MTNLGGKGERLVITDNQIHQFVRLEKAQYSTSANFMEALIEGVKVLCHRFVQNIIYVEVNVLLPRRENIGKF